MFARRGLEAGLDEIAREAGVGTATVYRRYPDKADLSEALFDQRMQDLGELADAAGQEPDAWTGLVAYIEAVVQIGLEDRGLKELMLGENVSPSVVDRFRRRRDQATAAIATLIGRAKKQGRLRPDVELTDVAMLLVMLDTVGTFLAPAAPDHWRRPMQLMLDGMRTGGADAGALRTPALPLDAFEGLCGLPPESTRP